MAMFETSEKPGLRDSRRPPNREAWWCTWGGGLVSGCCGLLEPSGLLGARLKRFWSSQGFWFREPLRGNGAPGGSRRLQDAAGGKDVLGKVRATLQEGSGTKGEL